MGANPLLSRAVRVLQREIERLEAAAESGPLSAEEALRLTGYIRVLNAAGDVGDNTDPTELADDEIRRMLQEIAAGTAGAPNGQQPVTISEAPDADRDI